MNGPKAMAKAHGPHYTTIVNLSTPKFDFKAKAKALEDSTREITEQCDKRVAECHTAIDGLRNHYAEIIAEATTEAASIKKAAAEEAKRTMATVKAEKTAWEEEKARLAHIHSFEKIIKLNVGGTKFATSLATLKRCPETMLAAMFSGRHEIPKDDEGHYFIDQDGTHFGEILNYLRSPETYTVELAPSELNKLKQQCKYYGLLEIMFRFTPAPPTTVYNVYSQVCEVTQNENRLWHINKIPMKVCRTCGARCGPQRPFSPKFSKARAQGAVQRAASARHMSLMPFCEEVGCIKRVGSDSERNTPPPTLTVNDPRRSVVLITTAHFK
jgi:hypothetical protein